MGQVEGTYAAEESLPEDFLRRRTAGNAIEALGVVAFRASPVWVLAALADVCGMGRQLIPEIAYALKAQGLLEQETTFTSVDQVLDGLERTSSRLAGTINTPPLDVASLVRNGRRFATRRAASSRNRCPATSPSEFDSVARKPVQFARRAWFGGRGDGSSPPSR